MAKSLVTAGEEDRADAHYRPLETVRNVRSELLGPVYAWFTECFDTRDLQDAKALLEELE